MLNLGLMLKYQIMHTEGIVMQCYHIREVVSSLFDIRIGAGLPNITARTAGESVASIWLTRDRDTFNNNFTGAIRPWYGGSWEHSCAAHIGTIAWGLNFNASLSSTIYGSSGTVTPLSLTAKLILKY